MNEGRVNANFVVQYSLSSPWSDERQTNELWNVQFRKSLPICAVRKSTAVMVS
jgi:hypothetical protein